MKIKLPFKSIEEIEDPRRELISQYFSGRELRLNSSCDQLEIELFWPEDPAYYIDENLKDGLSWWGDGLEVVSIPFARRRYQHFQLSLNDNWTLFSWSEWLAKKLKKNDVKKLIILHIDDHRDCMAPLLFKDINQNLIDPLTGSKVVLNDPSSIIKSIESGAIAVGSFMPVMFHSIAQIEFRHLMPEHRIPNAHRGGGLENYFEKDMLLFPEKFRPSVKFEHNKGCHTYLPTADLKMFLEDIDPSVPILLHVDMDYFNNRFDGDSDWTHHNFRHDPELNIVLGQIDSVFSKIIERDEFAQIEDISIALSPGFFPAEFWKGSIERINKIFQEAFNDEQLKTGAN